MRRASFPTRAFSNHTSSSAVETCFKLTPLEFYCALDIKEKCFSIKEKGFSMGTEIIAKLRVKEGTRRRPPEPATAAV